MAQNGHRNALGLRERELRIMNRELGLVLVIDNVRSLYNVGSLFRTADSVGAEKIIITGISPYPKLPNDPRRSLEAERIHQAIAKTALGAESTVAFEYMESIAQAIKQLKDTGHAIYALEQAKGSKNIFKFDPKFPCALIVGHERDGVQNLDRVDAVLEIPQFGRKESLNVAVAAGIALYALAQKLN